MCYAYKGQSQWSCDLLFLRNMRSQCASNSYCKFLALTAYNGVKYFGKSSYDKGQKAAKWCKQERGIESWFSYVQNEGKECYSKCGGKQRDFLVAPKTVLVTRKVDKNQKVDKKVAKSAKYHPKKG